MRATTTKTTRVNRQSDMRDLSTEEVLVTIHISEKERVRTFDGISAALKGEAESGLTARLSGKTEFKVTVTGPHSQVTALESDNITLYADISGLGAGQYELPVQCSVDGGGDITASVEPATVSVTIEAAAQ